MSPFTIPAEYLKGPATASNGKIIPEDHYLCRCGIVLQISAWAKNHSKHEKSKQHRSALGMDTAVGEICPGCQKTFRSDALRRHLEQGNTTCSSKGFVMARKYNRKKASDPSLGQSRKIGSTKGISKSPRLVKKSLVRNTFQPLASPEHPSPLRMPGNLGDPRSPSSGPTDIITARTATLSLDAVARSIEDNHPVPHHSYVTSASSSSAHASPDDFWFSPGQDSANHVSQDALGLLLEEKPNLAIPHDHIPSWRGIVTPNTDYLSPTSLPPLSMRRQTSMPSMIQIMTGPTLTSLPSSSKFSSPTTLGGSSCDASPVKFSLELWDDERLYTTMLPPQATGATEPYSRPGLYSFPPVVTSVLTNLPSDISIQDLHQQQTFNESHQSSWKYPPELFISSFVDTHGTSSHADTILTPLDDDDDLSLMGFQISDPVNTDGLPVDDLHSFFPSYHASPPLNCSPPLQNIQHQPAYTPPQSAYLSPPVQTLVDLPDRGYSSPKSSHFSPGLLPNLQDDLSSSTYHNGQHSTSFYSSGPPSTPIEGYSYFFPPDITPTDSDIARFLESFNGSPVLTRHTSDSTSASTALGTAFRDEDGRAGALGSKPPDIGSVALFEAS